MLQHSLVISISCAPILVCQCFSPLIILLPPNSSLLEPPTVTAPATVKVLSGSRVALWCTVQTGAPAKVQWIMDRRTLGPVVTRIRTANVTHIIPSVTNKDQGPYSCFASNVGGTATAITTVVVNGKKLAAIVLISHQNQELGITCMSQMKVALKVQHLERKLIDRLR